MKDNQMVLKNANFILLLTSLVFNAFGGLLLNVAVISVVYTVTSSIASASFILVLNTIASIVGGFIASNFLDRVSHKKIMLFSDLFSCILVFFLALIVSYIGINIIVVYITTFLTTIISSFFIPARSAIVPNIVQKEQLIRANSFLVSVIQITTTAGWIVAIPIVLTFGSILSIYLISFTFLISTVLIMFLSVEKQEDNVIPVGYSFIYNFKTGLNTLWKNKVLKSITMMDIGEAFANIVWASTFLLSFTVEILDSSEKWWGYQGATFLIGSIVGGLITAKYADRIRLFGGKVIIYSSLGVALITFAYGLNTIPIIALVISFFTGLPYQIRNIVQESLLQEYAENKILGRVFAVRNILIQFFYAFALFFGSFLADKIGIVNVYILAGMIYTLVTVYAFSSAVIRNFNINNSDYSKSKRVNLND